MLKKEAGLYLLKISATEMGCTRFLSAAKAPLTDRYGPAPSNLPLRSGAPGKELHFTAQRDRYLQPAPAADPAARNATRHPAGCRTGGAP